MEHFDVAVVGLGVLGSAAAYHSALKGAKVVAFEQFELGHVHGASHDTSRIVRTSYHASEYVALAKAAYTDWAHLENATGYKLFHQTGGLIFLPQDGLTSGQSLSDYTQSLTANNIPHEILNAAQLKKRWPQFAPGDNVVAVYTADSGIVHAARSVAAMQQLARTHGAVLKEHTRVERVTPDTDRTRVTLTTSSGQFTASKVILATDAWTNKLLAPLGAEIPLTVMQEQVTYYKPTDPAAFESHNFPVWIWSQDTSVYGFPCFGEPTIKVGLDNAKNYMAPEDRTYVHSPKLLERLNSFLGAFIPDDTRQELRTVTCQYTITPDRQFVISPLKRHGNIIVALGAAHAFKFAPAIGRAVAELAIDGKTDADISKFGIPKTSSLDSKL